MVKLRFLVQEYPHPDHCPGLRDLQITKHNLHKFNDAFQYTTTYIHERYVLQESMQIEMKGVAEMRDVMESSVSTYNNVGMGNEP